MACEAPPYNYNSTEMRIEGVKRAICRKQRTAQENLSIGNDLQEPRI